MPGQKAGRFLMEKMMALIPYIVAFCAVSCYAMLGPLAKKIGATLPPFTFLTICSLLLILMGALPAYFLEKEKVVAEFQNIKWGWLAALAVVNFVGYMGWLYAVNRIPIAQYQMFGVMSPVIGGLLAYFLLKENFEPRYLLALAFMAVGLFIAIKPKF
jgi:drug/metabolite transporter (DMT)-like permease